MLQRSSYKRTSSKSVLGEMGEIKYVTASFGNNGKKNVMIYSSFDWQKVENYRTPTTNVRS